MRVVAFFLFLTGVQGAKRLTPIDDCVNSSPRTFTKVLKRELCRGVTSFASASATVECAGAAMGRAALNPAQVVELCAAGGHAAGPAGGRCVTAAQQSLKSLDQLPPPLRLQLCVSAPWARPEAPVECALAAGKLTRKQPGLLRSRGAEWLTSARHRVDLCRGAGVAASEASAEASAASRATTTLRSRNTTVIVAGSGGGRSEAAGEAAARAAALGPVSCLEAFLSSKSPAGAGGGNFLGAASSNGGGGSASASGATNMVAIELCRGAASAAPGRCGAAAARMQPASLRPPLDLLPQLCGSAFGNSVRALAAFTALAHVHAESSGSGSGGGGRSSGGSSGESGGGHNDIAGDGGGVGNDFKSNGGHRDHHHYQHSSSSSAGEDLPLASMVSAAEAASNAADGELSEGPVACVAAAPVGWSHSQRVRLCAGAPTASPAHCAASVGKHFGSSLLPPPPQPPPSSPPRHHLQEKKRDHGGTTPLAGETRVTNDNVVRVCQWSPSAPSSPASALGRPSLALFPVLPGKSISRSSSATGSADSASSFTEEEPPYYFPSPAEVALCVVSSAPLALTAPERFDLCDPKHFVVEAAAAAAAAA
mmetsp:Transcript_74097/g.149291  ORF Transcript_74097/g.149291 Transcript_74097/m.149291 type:complete len:595 (+) Transcript_74097:57-1841(+)